MAVFVIGSRPVWDSIFKCFPLSQRRPFNGPYGLPCARTCDTRMGPWTRIWTSQQVMDPNQLAASFYILILLSSTACSGQAVLVVIWIYHLILSGTTMGSELSQVVWMLAKPPLRSFQSFRSFSGSSLSRREGEAMPSPSWRSTLYWQMKKTKGVWKLHRIDYYRVNIVQTEQLNIVELSSMSRKWKNGKLHYDLLCLLSCKCAVFCAPGQAVGQ